MIINSFGVDPSDARIFCTGECFAFAERLHERTGLPMVLMGGFFEPVDGFVEESDWCYPFDFEACHTAIKVTDSLFWDARGLFTIDEGEVDNYLFMSNVLRERVCVINCQDDIELVRSFTGGMEDTHTEILMTADKIIDAAFSFGSNSEFGDVITWAQMIPQANAAPVVPVMNIDDVDNQASLESDPLTVPKDNANELLEQN